MKYINDRETISLAQQGDAQALEAIVTSNMGLIKSVAARFLNRGTEFEDLVQIGTIGMIKAIRRFDCDLSVAFTTYAVPMIIGEIRRYLRDDGLIKISRSAKINNAKICAFCRDFKAEKGTQPTVSQISRALEISEEDVIFALDASRPVLSLYDKDEENGFSPEDTLGEDEMEKVFDSIALSEALKQLTESEEKLIRLRYFKHLTQDQTAKLLGISQVKVSRDEKKICQKLKELLA